MPTEQEVTSFLDECCEVARSAVETRLAATRSAAASSLGMDEYGLDKKFASNCINARIKTLQDQARQANQQMQGIQQEAESAVQSGMASAAGAAAAADALRAEEALVQLKLEDEVSRLRMQVKFLDAVPQQVAGFVGAGAFLKRSWSTTARRQDGTTAPAPSLPVEFQVPQDDFGQKTLLDFTQSQLRGQRSQKTALSEDQQVALLQRARSVIQLIVPAPARPESGSVKDTSIDTNTLTLQVPS